MSGMEALAAFGLACNVMQTIDFTLATVKVCKEVFRTGSLDRSKAERIAESLKVSESFNQWMLSASPMTESQREVYDLAEKAQNATLELKKEVDKLTSPSAKGKVITTIKHTFRGGLREKDIAKLEKNAEEWRRILESRLLAQICQKNDAVLLQGQSGFDELNETMREFIQKISQGHTNMEVLLDKNRASINDVTKEEARKTEQAISATLVYESSKTREEMNSAFKIISAEPPMWQKRQTFLSSLKYDSMNERFNRIPEPHEGTYQWVLRGTLPWKEEYDGTMQSNEVPDPPHSHPDCSHGSGFQNVRWNCFPCWLKSPNDKVYWVQGKAGSGKSTLMKFMVAESRFLFTSKFSSQYPVILRHFLWAAGPPMQRSIRGILLSLLTQFLVVNEKAVDEIVKSLPPSDSSKFKAEDWNRDELEKIIFPLFTKSDKAIIIFLDGLDEMGDSENSTDTPAHLLRLVAKLAAIKKVKLCLSSRPEPVFASKLGTRPTLRLQDLTRLDMKKYAEHRLLQSDFKADDPEFSELVETLLDKAAGVFLWMSMALNSLDRGRINDDTIEELRLRLENLPSGLIKLYQDMWSRLNDDELIYRQEAARYFNMLRAWAGFDVGHLEVFHVMLAWDPSVARDILRDYSALTAEEIESKCQVTAKRIKTRTAELMEIGLDGQVVGFTHRSALEFFENTEEGKGILGYDTTPPESCLSNLVRAFFAGVCLQVLGKRRTMFYSEITVYAVMTKFTELWASGRIPEAEGLDLMLSCKKLYETGRWGLVPNSPDPIHSILDFYGLAAAFGLRKVVSHMEKDPVVNPKGKVAVSMPYRRYLFVATSMDPDVFSTVDYNGKLQILCDVLGDSKVAELESSLDDKCLENGGIQECSGFPFMFLALLNIHIGGRHWPASPSMPLIEDVVKRYVAMGYALGETVAITFRRSSSDIDGDDCWRPNVHSLGFQENYYKWRNADWVTLETSLAALAELCLMAVVAGSKSKSEQAVTAQAALFTLRNAIPNRPTKLVAIGIASHNGSALKLKEKYGKPLAPATAEDAGRILDRFNLIQCVEDEQAVKELGEHRHFKLPGLWSRLKKVALRAREMEQTELDQAIDLPSRRLLKDFMSRPPKPYMYAE
ncbi:hypothetical protein B0T19DRAFT_459915 [Cercophora scortea]|uniref:NACHT domain-containing protein n=1 Tax=Cercophora scortea TaxID=314031 RepID=A0AAE0IKR8_9PEZI|nr:hypothetical protein B0T19DRAFT_459915 [Cercophora scortea]